MNWLGYFYSSSFTLVTGKDPTVISRTFQMLEYIAGRILILHDSPIKGAWVPNPGDMMKSRFYFFHISRKFPLSSFWRLVKQRY